MTLAWPKAVPRWRKMLLAYKQAKTNPNPFEEPYPGKIIDMRTYNGKLNDSQTPG